MSLCEGCGRRPAVPSDSEWPCDWLCADCNEQRAERAYERSQEGECFRGGEAAAFEAEQMAKIQRELK